MIRKAKPWILACGTFSWRIDDPGEEVPDVDTIVARSFAHACRERRQHLVLLTEHIACVRRNPTSLTSFLFKLLQVKGLVTAYRHSVKEAVVLLVEKYLGFTDGEQRYNRELVEWFLPDRFQEAVGT